MDQPLKITRKIRLKNFDPDFHQGLDKDETRLLTGKIAQRISELQEMLYANDRQTVLIVFQGMDCSGKDGATKHVLDAVNPAGVDAVSFKAPTHEELAHDFLWRIHRAIPAYGKLGVFNRSHYEDVLIVRVLEMVPPAVWKARFQQINAFEKFLSDNRVILLKFFLHISKKEQSERLQARLYDPSKRWKFQASDLKMRERWGAFQEAYEDVLNKCSTPWAPWYVVPADRKWYRDYVIAKVVVQRLEDLKLRWPKGDPGLPKVRSIK